MKRLPPYGKMGESYQVLLKRPIMSGWMPHAPEEERIKSFKDWQQSIIDDIAAHLWPRYCRDSARWRGKSASFAEAATVSEIEVMIAAFQSTNLILDEMPTSPNIVANPRPHRWHYQQEDNLATPLAVNYDDYDRTLSKADLAELRTITQSIYDDKVDGLFAIKDTFLRPRPYQASMILGLQHFRSETCRSGLHSAMNSGHCLEGILFCCNMLDHWIATGRSPTAASKASLAQFAVDFGDRRVFAGVHYPTDNIAGWTIALSLIPHFFPGKPDILAFARGAIVDCSRVYRVIRNSFGGHDTLAPALAMLNRVVAHAPAAI